VAVDPRMKAIATGSMYNMGRDRRQRVGDTMTKEDRSKDLDEVAEQRWIEFEGEQRKYVIGTLEVITESSPGATRELYDYYRTPRGHHPPLNDGHIPDQQHGTDEFLPVRANRDGFPASDSVRRRRLTGAGTSAVGHYVALYIMAACSHAGLLGEWQQRVAM
jgi:hypothetical protein